jgi:UDP-glucose 4-epimerase
MAILITGAAGFIGSNLVSHFLEKNENVFGLDNLCRGSLINLNEQIQDSRFTFLSLDLNDLSNFKNVVRDYAHSITEVWHLAANSDIPAGIADPQIDLKDTFLTTFLP